MTKYTIVNRVKRAPRERASKRIVECEQEVSRVERDQTDLDKRVQSISFENYTDT